MLVTNNWESTNNIKKDFFCWPEIFHTTHMLNSVEYLNSHFILKIKHRFWCSRQCASYLFRELVPRVYECSDHTCPAPSTALLSGGEPQSLPQPHVLRTEANADLRHRDVCLLGVRGQGQHRVRGWAHPLYSRKSDPTCSSSDQPSSLKLSVVPLWL